MSKRLFSSTFDRIKVGCSFSKNGNTWLKRSSKTAEIVAPKQPYHGRWFYFKNTEQVIITDREVLK